MVDNNIIRDKMIMTKWIYDPPKHKTTSINFLNKHPANIELTPILNPSNEVK